MVKQLKDHLENLWIINNEGVCYYHQKFDESVLEMNQVRFSGFISAILTFTQDVFKDQFKKLTLGGMDIFIQSFSAIFVVVSCKKGVNEKLLIKILHSIGKSFENQFSNVLKNEFISATMFDEFILPIVGS